MAQNVGFRNPDAEYKPGAYRDHVQDRTSGCLAQAGADAVRGWGRGCSSRWCTTGWRCSGWWRRARASTTPACQAWSRSCARRYRPLSPYAADTSADRRCPVCA
eukprot:2529066-Rhodomonas_salina.1